MNRRKPMRSKKELREIIKRMYQKHPVTITGIKYLIEDEFQISVKGKEDIVETLDLWYAPTERFYDSVMLAINRATGWHGIRNPRTAYKLYANAMKSHPDYMSFKSSIEYASNISKTSRGKC